MRKLCLLLVLFILTACNLKAAASTSISSLEQGNSTVILPSDTGLPTLTPLSILPVPSSTATIEGAAYDVFQASGDPFRFVCPHPCTVDPELIFAQYAGFRAAYEIMLGYTGVDTLAELQPVDLHIKNDPLCGELSKSPALSYAVRDPGGHAYICTFLFEYAKGYQGQPYSPEIAVRLDQQVIFIHEYLHTIFFGRTTGNAGAMHDFVTPLAMVVGGLLHGDDELCAYHPESPPGDYGGYLIQQLCAQNGFRLEDLRLSLIELDSLYSSDGGLLQEEYRHLVPSMVQFREILNRVLGSETSQAFIDACWPARLFDEDYILPESCLYRTPTVKPTAIP
jgi:hypothetical protein